MPNAHLVADCPRCGTKRITFDVLAANLTGMGHAGWNRSYEVPAVCRHCDLVTLWNLELKNYAWSSDQLLSKLWSENIDLNDGFIITDYVSLKDATGVPTPEHVPENIGLMFSEASTSKAVGCPNASAAMSRLCLDLVTKAMLPDPEDTSVAQPNSNQRKRLFDRLDFLFAHRLLPNDLKELAGAIREHGNDGAHDGVCTDLDAEDLLDFTQNVLERIFTVPERARQAKSRAIARRAPKE